MVGREFVLPTEITNFHFIWLKSAITILSKVHSHQWMNWFLTIVIIYKIWDASHDNDSEVVTD